MRLIRFLLPLLLALGLGAQNPETADYPLAVVDDDTLTVLNNEEAPVTLTSDINDSDLTIPVSSTTQFVDFPLIVTIGQERLLIASKGGSNLTATSRGFDCQRPPFCNAAAHLSGQQVRLYLTARHVNQLYAEMIAVQTALGASLANVVTQAELHAGTDPTADLEEETHASEHESGGNDQITIDGLDAGAATTRTNELKVQICSHNTDVTSLTDGVARELCFEEDDNALYICEPTAGGCDTAGEWTGPFNVASGPTVTSGTFGAKPGSPASGDVHFLTGGSVYEHLRYDGSAWVGYRDGRELTLPPTTGWSWVNQDTATIDSTEGYLHLTTGGGTGTVDLQLRVRSEPTPPYTITVGFEWSMHSDDTNLDCGVVWRESGTGEIKVLRWIGTNFDIRHSNYSDPQTFVSEDTLMGNWYHKMYHDRIFWAQIEDNNTNRIVRLGDGQDWTQFHSEGNTIFLSADQVGFFCDGEGGVAQQMKLFHWKEE